MLQRKDAIYPMIITVLLIIVLDSFHSYLLFLYTLAFFSAFLGIFWLIMYIWYNNYKNSEIHNDDFSGDWCSGLVLIFISIVLFGYSFFPSYIEDIPGYLQLIIEDFIVSI